MKYTYERVETGITNCVRVIRQDGIGVASFAYDAFGGRDGAMKAAKSYDPNYIEAPEIDIRDAMQDLLNSPKGVVPDSASQFYDANNGTFSTASVRDFLSACS